MDAAGSALLAPLAPSTRCRCSARWLVGRVCIADGTLVHAWAGAGLAKIPRSMRTFG